MNFNIFRKSFSDLGEKKTPQIMRKKRELSNGVSGRDCNEKCERKITSRKQQILIVLKVSDLVPKRIKIVGDFYPSGLYIYTMYINI